MQTGAATKGVNVSAARGSAVPTTKAPTQNVGTDPIDAKQSVALQSGGGEPTAARVSGAGPTAGTHRRWLNSTILRGYASELLSTPCRYHE